MPPGLVTFAVAERDGIRVSLEIERNPLEPGRTAWATTEVRNTGTDGAVVWAHDGCATAIRVRGVMADVRWRPGRPQAGAAADFKAWALEYQGIEQGDIAVVFTPDAFAGLGRYGCREVRIEERIAPGAAVRQRAAWDGAAHLRLGPPPPGRIELVGTAGPVWREQGGEPSAPADRYLDLRLSGWMTDGRDPGLLDPPEVLDAALGSERFASWIAGWPLRREGLPILRFEARAGLWEVGILDVGTNRAHVALVDPRSGSVTDVVDRRWDPSTDGLP